MVRSISHPQQRPRAIEAARIGTASRSGAQHHVNVRCYISYGEHDTAHKQPGPRIVWAEGPDLGSYAVRAAHYALTRVEPATARSRRPMPDDDAAILEAVLSEIGALLRRRPEKSQLEVPRLIIAVTKNGHRYASVNRRGHYLHRRRDRARADGRPYDALNQRALDLC